MKCYLLSEPKVRCYRKRTLNLWLNKGMFWVSDQRLTDQENTIHRNSWMTELEIEELERMVAENDCCKEEERSADNTGNNLGEEVTDILTELEADGKIGNLEEEEVKNVKRKTEKQVTTS